MQDIYVILEQMILFYGKLVLVIFPMAILTYAAWQLKNGKSLKQVIKEIFP